MVDNVALYDALKILCDRLKDIEWAVYGSLNLRLQGLDVKFSDIDIIVSIEDIYKVEKRLRDLLKTKTSKSTSLLGLCYKAKFEVEGYEIEVLADDLENSRNSFSNWDSAEIVDLSYRGLEFKGFSLRKEYENYKLLNRERDSEKIEMLRKVI